MNKLLLIFLIGSAVCLDAQDWHKRWSEAGTTWAQKWSNTMDSINEFQPNERIEILSSALGVAQKGGLREEEKPIFYRAQSMLLGIPGHAKYYQDKIERMRAELLTNSKKSPQEIIKMQNEGIEVIDEPNYLSDTESALRTLKFMPSAETVSVLGHFLNDPEGRDGKTLLGNPRSRPGDDFPARASSAEVATEMIRALGIEHPPSKESQTVTKITAEEIDAWKDWWNEVKDGKRTYRFVGSKIEYGPEGPASKDAVLRAERNQKRDEERATGNRRTSAASNTAPANTPPNKLFPVTGLIAACILSAIAVWYFMKKSQT